MNSTVTDTERYRTARKRLWAAIVDSILFMPLLLVARYLVYPTNNENLIIAWQTFMVFIPLVYSIVGHYKYGLTVGKWAADIKVLDKTESKLITLRQSFVRDSFYVAVEIAGFIYYLTLSLKTGDKTYLYNGFYSFSDFPFLIWTLLELVTMLTNEKRRAIHDYMANSVVVRTR